MDRNLQPIFCMPPRSGRVPPALALVALGTLGLIGWGGCAARDVTDAGPLDGAEGGASLDGGTSDRDGAPGPRLEPSCADVEASYDACCVGNATCCSPSGESVVVSLDACADGAYDACTTDTRALAFGVAPPVIQGGGLIGGPGGIDFSGVQLGDGFDPRGVNATVRATIDVPATSCTSCIDVAGVALLDRIPSGAERASIRVGLLANAVLGRVQLIVSDEVVETLPLPIGENAYELATRIDGTINVTAGATQRVVDAALGDELYGTLLARTDDPGPEGYVVIRSGSLGFESCDAPGALERSPTPAIDVSAAPGLSAPSVLTRSTGERYVFFEVDGRILVSDVDPITHALSTPRVAAEPSTANEAYGDPWVTEVDGALELYVTSRSTGPASASSIARATSADTSFADLQPVTVLEGPYGAFELTQPTVTVDLDGTHWLIGVARSDLGFASLARWRSDDRGETWSYSPVESVEGILRAPHPNDLFAVDRDEVADPALLFASGLYRLYYAARRGTRWTIAVLVSEDLRAWYPRGEVLGPRESGFDALGARAPAPFEVGSDGPIGLYYLGLDGATSVLRRADPTGT
ncbi:MAG: hypothetical protein AB7S26_34655 [Sandaracinaceae bacterium]